MKKRRFLNRRLLLKKMFGLFPMKSWQEERFRQPERQAFTEAADRRIQKRQHRGMSHGFVWGILSLSLKRTGEKCGFGSVKRPGKAEIT